MNLFILAFQLGLFTFLNPIVFPLLIHNIFLFEKTENKTSGYKINILLFCGITILLITYFFPNLVIEGTIKQLITDKRITYFMNIPYLIFLIWVIITNLSKYEQISSNYFKQLFRFIGISTFIFWLFIGSFSGFGPILTSQMLDQSVNRISAFGFSIGLTIPFLIFLLLISPKYESLKLKKWWKITQSIICCYLILNLLIKTFK